MNSNRYIRHFAAAVLLLIFSMGNTPKAAFHFLFADHTDDFTVIVDGETVKTPGKTCDILDLVCSLPYQAVATTFINSQEAGMDLRPVVSENSSPFGFTAELSLRGPPAAFQFAHT